jgi:trehalose 6-phosphate phosphatase
MDTDVLAPFRPLGPGALVATDFDGTLAPIVADPAAAAPLPGAIDTLERLGATGATIVVVSGRPLAFLERHLPPGVTVVGLYGLEVRRDGTRVDHPAAGVWRETMADVAAAAERKGPDGMLVELKGLSITLHYREHPELAGAVRAYAEEVADAAGLVVRSARMSVELHPPIQEDKGTAVARFAEEVDGPVMFLGDDVGDLAAFDALDELAAHGRATARVVADSDEIEPVLRERADVVVEGPDGVLELLRSLL